MESEIELVHKVRLCMSRNLSKLAIAMLLLGILTLLIMSFSIAPMAGVIMTGTMSVASIISLLVSVIAVSAINYVLQYGFFVLGLCLYRKEYAVLGHLFAGFRDFKRAFITGLFYTLIYTTVLFIISFALSFGVAVSFVSEVMQEFNTLLIILGGVSILVLGILYLRYGFVWFILYDQPKLGVKDALRESALLTQGKRLTFIVFCIKSAGVFLAIVVCAFVVMRFLPTHTDATQSTSMFSFPNIVSTAYTLCLYASLIRISIGFSAWYTAYSDSKPTEGRTQETVIELSDAHTDDSPKQEDNQA